MARARDTSEPGGKGEKKLAKYAAKRDFGATDEPSGLDDAEIRSSDHLRFVIQKHDARRLHYDLRLEADGVFLSWAVTRGPSLDPGEKRLAVEVEDHPLAYGDFEGTIPEGEYGGGTVMIWDRGFWAPETDEDVGACVKRGELKFVLAGTKLAGGYVLVRMKPKDGEEKRNWLLIKHKDDWATPGEDNVLDKDRSVASGRTMAQIASGRGAAPEPFMTVGGSATAAARWDEDDTRAAKLKRLRDKAGADPRPPKLSTPDRVLWPDCGLTKSDLAGYLMEAAGWMMPHLAGRPCSLVRAPEGIGGETFFQRHVMPGLPDGVTRVTVADDSQDYIQFDDAQTLVDVAQVSAIEFHPWNSAPLAPEVPGRLVFDLDPGPDVPFDDVVAAARDVRDRLEALGLAAFCKTTGGKGLHVVSPLSYDSGLGFEQAKLFSQTVAAKLASDEPGRFVTKMTKQVRKGRIFIDYLRNDWKATAVAPLSPRARPGAPVSMPLNWTQVRKGLDPSRFTLTSAIGLLDKSDAWADYDASHRPLGAAIGALLKDH